MTDLSQAEWLNDLLSGVESVESSPEPAVREVITPSGALYRITAALGETTRYNLYSCRFPTGETGWLKIAASPEFNAALDREALLLRTMSVKAEAIEKKVKPGEAPYNYQYFFPKLEESFEAEDQNRRRINILSCSDGIQLADRVPLSKIEAVSRIDPKSAVWIFGKTLKTLGLAHDLDIANGFVSLSNVLVHTGEHAVIVFDWTQGSILVSPEAKKTAFGRDISGAALMTLQLLGTDDSGNIPESDQLPDNRFCDFLVQMAKTPSNNANTAHRLFYKLTDELWPRAYHEFTTYPK